mgnify:CR=1 FL=1|tara:strand:+ start:818 stop:1000 length:183 start_codon:yes stop_codon:yes gene_type:complete
MQFKKKTSSGKNNLVAVFIKFCLGLVILIGVVFFLNTIDFPAPKKEIDKVIPNENFKIVK